MMLRVRSPISVQKVTVRIYLVLVRAILTWRPVRGPDRDREIEYGWLDDHLLADYRNSLALVRNPMMSAQATGRSRAHSIDRRRRAQPLESGPVSPPRHELPSDSRSNVDMVTPR